MSRTVEAQSVDAPAFTRLTDLAYERLGGVALAANDEFFAEKENLLKSGRGVFIEDKYTDRGKWMDGWETRRRRTPGHDWCIVKLGAPGFVHGFDVDTNHFLGNNPESCTIEVGCFSDDADVNWLTSPDASWQLAAPQSPLLPGSQNFISASDPIGAGRVTHVRLNIHPDGGVARLRVYGEPAPDWQSVPGGSNVAAIELGARVVDASDMFFSEGRNLLLPDSPLNMGDGWETKRRRGPGNDWIVIRLAAPAKVQRVVVDTSFFKGNYPDSFSLEGARFTDDNDQSVEGVQWHLILDQTKLQADDIATFDVDDGKGQSFATHVRLNIFPDGGVARLRLYGKIDRTALPGVIDS